MKIAKLSMLSAIIGLVCLSISPAAAQTVRLCTGAASGNYFAAGDMIKKMAGASLDIEVVETEGTIDNLDRLLTVARRSGLHLSQLTSEREEAPPSREPAS
jgi:TRAP-type uncharacterized transport system substrate-binding protein